MVSIAYTEPDSHGILENCCKNLKERAVLVSHRYRFIFIKTKKTAGTSIEIALSRFLGADDIITHISPDDEALREQLGNPGPQNYYIPCKRYQIADWIRLLGNRQRLYYFNHMSAFDIKRYLGEEIWNNYYKFCFERNPWDKVISWYYWEYRDTPKPWPSLHQFVDSGQLDHLAGPGGRDLYTIDGSIAVDDVFLYENLEQTMELLTDRLGLPEQPQLPRAKSGFRQDRRNYRDIFGPEREVVSRLFEAEIRQFGYHF